MTEIAQACRDENWRLAVWNVHRGLQVPGQPNAPAEVGGGDPSAN